MSIEFEHSVGPKLPPLVTILSTFTLNIHSDTCSSHAPGGQGSSRSWRRGRAGAAGLLKLLGWSWGTLQDGAGDHLSEIMIFPILSALTALWKECKPLPGTTNHHTPHIDLGFHTQYTE